MALRHTVTANLAHARQKAGLTQEELAIAAKVSLSYVSMLMRGQRIPPLDTLEDLAKALGTSLAYLLTDHGLPLLPAPVPYAQRAVRSPHKRNRKVPSLLPRLAANMIACRKAAAMPLRVLATKVGCSLSEITLIESARRDPSLDTVARIAYALDVSAIYLLQDLDLSALSPPADQVAAARRVGLNPFGQLPSTSNARAT